MRLSGGESPPLRRREGLHRRRFALRFPASLPLLRAHEATRDVVFVRVVVDEGASALGRVGADHVGERICFGRANATTDERVQKHET